MVMMSVNPPLLSEFLVEDTGPAYSWDLHRGTIPESSSGSGSFPYPKEALVFLGCQSCIEVVDIEGDAAIEHLQTLGIAQGFSPEPSKKVSESTIHSLYGVGCFFTLDVVLGR